MGFSYPDENKPAATTQTTGTQSRRTSTQDPKTRIAYINMYLPTSDGTRVKLVSDLTLGLYLEKAAEKQLVELIKQGVITEEQAGSLIQVEINLTRDESKPLVLDLSKLGLVNPASESAE